MADEKDKKQKGQDRLSVIRRGLYAKEEPELFKKRQEKLHQLGITKRPKGELETPDDTLAVTRYRNLAWQRAKRLGRIFKVSGFLLLLLVVLVWVTVLVVWYRSSVTVTEEQAVVSIEAPKAFTAGEEIVYTVFYENASRVDWLDVELIFEKPRGFEYLGSDQELKEDGRQLIWELGSLPAGASGRYEVRGQLIGEQNETTVAQAEIVLTPENFPSGRFSKPALFATTITALSLDVAVAIPNDAAGGERIVATIDARNLSQNELRDVYVRLNPAPGVQLLTDDHEFSPGFLQASKEWIIPSIASLQGQKLQFVFAVQGQPGEQRIIELETGIEQDQERFIQRELTQVIRVSASEVTVQQFYNDVYGPLVLTAGEQVKGEVRYGNVGTTGLKDVILQVQFEGTAFDPESLQLQSGAYDSETRTISWSPATVPELAVVQPQETGVIPYSFSVRSTDDFPANAETGKNNVIVSTATVDSPDLPAPVGQPRKVVSDRAVLSVASDAILESTAFYDDGRLGITSSGPVPPRVGERTTYTVRTRIGTTLNDVTRAQVKMVLPDGVSYTGESFKTGGDFTFNERTGEFVWTIEQLAGLTGRASPAEELHLQVAITPGENVRGSVLPFLNFSELTFVDQFTDTVVTKRLDEFPSTDSLGGNNGAVE